MERKEAYEQIKKLGLQEVCKKMYGKNFTQCKTNELEKIINKAKIKAKIKVTNIINISTKKIRKKSPVIKVSNNLSKFSIITTFLQVFKDRCYH